MTVLVDSNVILDILTHAAVKQWSLLTRDSKRYRTYFPSVTLITPDRAATL